MKIFLADDSVPVRERIKEMLAEIPGIEITGEAGDGLEAIKAIGELKPDAVILDIRMPGANGIEVLENIKRENPALLVIVLTYYPYPQYQEKCQDLGADFFFDKSTEFEKVTDVLKQFIQDSQSTACGAVTKGSTGVEE